VFEGHAIGGILRKPSLRGVRVCKHLEVFRISDLLARIDVNTVIGPS
jgi:hypothetical protein